jgi:Fe-S-cluster containining protein
MPNDLPVINLATATYECTFGRGCDGVCCREGRPVVADDEIARIADNLPKLLPLLRPEARRVATSKGFVGQRDRQGEVHTRVVGGWCIFFNHGCTLHQAGAEEGDKYRYKPAVCSLFPLEQDADSRWYVRQHGQFGEEWDLFCLNPANSPRPAAETLEEELELAKRLDAK